MTFWTANYAPPGSPIRTATPSNWFSGGPEPGALRSKNAFDVGVVKIGADVEQGASVLPRDLVGEAVAEIQRRAMNALAPLGVGERHAPGRRGSHRDRLDADPVD